MTLLIVLLTLVVALQTVFVVGLLRSHATILRRLHELGAGVEPLQHADRGAQHVPAVPVSAAAPAGLRRGTDITGTAPDGAALGIRVVGATHDTLLVFLSTRCESCHPFWEDLARPEDLPLPAGTRVVIVTQGPEAELPAQVAGLAPPGTVVVMSSDAWTAYDVPGAPYVVHVEGPTGRVRELARPTDVELLLDGHVHDLRRDGADAVLM
jgi:hypothetical protein